MKISNVLRLHERTNRIAIVRAKCAYMYARVLVVGHATMNVQNLASWFSYVAKTALFLQATRNYNDQHASLAGFVAGLLLPQLKCANSAFDGTS